MEKLVILQSIGFIIIKRTAKSWFPPIHSSVIFWYQICSGGPTYCSLVTATYHTCDSLTKYSTCESIKSFDDLLKTFLNDVISLTGQHGFHLQDWVVAAAKSTCKINTRLVFVKIRASKCYTGRVGCISHWPWEKFVLIMPVFPECLTIC